jgi:tetratricopeptide (TPR) repeat protein
MEVMIKKFSAKNLCFNINYLRWIFVIALILVSCKSEDKPTETYIGVVKEKSHFVGSTSCMTCHKEAYSSWENSHHDQAMKIADSTSILGNFDNIVFTGKNIQSKFYKKGASYFVNTIGSDGTYEEFEIVYTFGVTPLQQYIIKFPNGAYQCLDIAWDVLENKWFNLQPDLNIDPEEWIHWTGGGMRWNTACADCHSTDLNKNYNSETSTFNTTFSEINVSCEACHGPASAHVDFYQNPSDASIPSKLNMDVGLSSKELVDKCARCHSRRAQITKKYTYEGTFLDHYSPSLLSDPLYELDGQIKDEDYVYGSFVQSKMYHNGVSCRDCHDVHSLKLKKEGNDLCMSCHEPKYNETSHHFHEINTQAAQCINCHMTGKIYMGNDFRRDHSFRIPRPDQSVKYGTPNACTGCHSDKSDEWARDIIIANYGGERADHFSDHLLPGHEGDMAALEKLMSEGQYPDVVRATALGLYSNQQFSSREINEVLKYLQDSSALVRNEAVLTLDRIAIKEISAYVAPLLMDSIRMVRISAFRYFNTTNIIPENVSDFDKSKKEFLEQLDMNSDFASGQHQIAIYHQSKGSTELAIKAYKKAIEIDNYYNTSRMNLALLQYTTGNVEEAEKLYLKVIEIEPDFSYSYYMLGLLYNETGQSERSMEYLQKACSKEPINVNAFYNYALKLQEIGSNEKSLTIVDKALKSMPTNERLLYVKLIGLINLNRTMEAYAICQTLVNIAPNNPSYQQLLGQLKQSL